MNHWLEEKKIVLEAAQKILEKGFVIGTVGNVSLRLPPEKGRGLLAITPSSRYYDSLDADDIQVVDFEAKPVAGELPPSAETMLHIGIYRARKNINAVIHTHSVYASAVSVAGLDIPAILDDQVVFLGGEIKLAKHALTGSREQVEYALAALEDRNAVLLPNHGAVATGRTMPETFTNCELIEKTAKVYLLALSTGKINPLPLEALETEKAFYDRLQSQSG
ncbi:class II aldolase/adducin family protein [Chloroflexota bacterium]